MPEPPEGDGEIDSETVESGEAEGGADQNDRDGGDAGDGDSKVALPVFVYISQEEFEAHLAQHPANVIRLKWDEPIVREAVDADKGRIMTGLGSEGEPSGVFHLTREEIALIR